MYSRLCKLPTNRSFFLFGPRQTGKSTLVRSILDPKSTWTVDLLSSETYIRYLKDPGLFRKEAVHQLTSKGATTILVDEVQRIPDLLNEVHTILESHRPRFVLTGSSARKLKRGGANLLAGRAVVRHLHPLTVQEIASQFDLDQALRFGTLPPVVTAETPDDKADILRAYTYTYLKEEIQAEGIARNIAGFSRFLDVAADQSGEVTNFSMIGRDAFLPARTVQSYFEILEETLIALRLDAYTRSTRRRLALHPKIYLFDIGVWNALSRRLAGEFDATQRGKLFEHFIVLESLRLLSYGAGEGQGFYWRTNHGAEVDLVLERNGKLLAAIEIKAKKSISSAALSGLRSFREEHPRAQCIVVSEAPAAFKLDFATVLPWAEYLKWLADEVL